jgi:hypothetical protein
MILSWASGLMQWCDQIFSASASIWCGMPWLTKNLRHVGADGGTIVHGPGVSNAAVKRLPAEGAR